MEHLQRDLRLLKGYAVVSSLLFVGVGVTAFTQVPQNARFAEITVERVNVVEPDGTLRLVISNRPRSPGPIARGQPFGYAAGGRPGLIFYNDEGTENGGLTFTGRADSGRYGATGHFSFDQYDQDQVVYLQYLDNNGERLMGLTVADRWDMPITEWVARRDSINRTLDGAERTAALNRLNAPRNGMPPFARRLFAGRDRSKTALVSLGDRMGAPRLRLSVDSLGTARIEFLDETGRVTLSLPDSLGRR